MDYFETDDILLSSFLLTQKAILHDIVESISNHFIFCFDGKTYCEKLKNDFLNNASAPARDLFSKREMLLSEIKQRSKKTNYDKQGFR